MLFKRNFNIRSIVMGTSPITASGGLLTLSEGYAVHTFITSGTFTVSSGKGNVEIFAWGGGGAGGTGGGWGYGAAGGGGGAAYGELTVSYGETYYITVGGAGIINSTTSATGGGGIASRNAIDNIYGGGGGGYSAVFNNVIPSQSAAIIMAGGGGGGGSSRSGEGNVGGGGGGLVGQDGTSAYDGKVAYAGRGGTQSAAGVDSNTDGISNLGFQGALQGGSPRYNTYGGAGGGGYWGGSAGGYSEGSTMAGGGGGSGFSASRIASLQLVAGVFDVPGNSNNILRGNAGQGGGAGFSAAGGRVVIRYPSIINTINYAALTYVVSGNLTITGNGTSNVTIFKTSGSAAWDNQAYSTTPFRAPCTIEFFKLADSADNGRSYAMMGWNTDPAANASYNTLDYTSYPYRSDTYSVHHNGTQVFFSGAWDPLKKFYIVYDTDGYIRHYNGSTLLYTEFYGTEQTVYIDSSFYSVNTVYAGFSNIRVASRSWNGTRYV
jgi:hypothetical protein